MTEQKEAGKSLAKKILYDAAAVGVFKAGELAGKAFEWAGKAKRKVDEKVIGFQLKHGIALGIGDTVSFDGGKTPRGKVRAVGGTHFNFELEIVGREIKKIDGKDKVILRFADETVDGTEIDIPFLHTLLEKNLGHVVKAAKNLSSELETTRIYGLVATAEEMIDSISTPEEREEARKELQEMKEEYFGFVAMTDWWHLAAGGVRGAYSHNFSEGDMPKVMGEGNKKGAEASRWVNMFLTGEHAESFTKGLGTPREYLRFEEFDDPYECMGAMLRISSGVSTRDQLNSIGDPIPENQRQLIYINNQRARVLKKDGTATDYFITNNGSEYELYKQLTLLEYAQKYGESRMELLDTVGYEFIKMEDDGQGGQIPVYRSHLDSDWLQGYDMFRNPGTMLGFWYSNLANLREEFVLQLGGQHFSNNQAENVRLNQIYLDTIQNLLGLNNANPGRNRTVADRAQLFAALGVVWNEAWDEAQKYDVLEGLGMLRRRVNAPTEEINGIPNPQRRPPWGYEEHYRLASRLIRLQTQNLTVKDWQKLDWKALGSTTKKTNNFMGHWCQQMYYLFNTRKVIIELLLGENILEQAEKLGSKEAYQHIPDILSPEAHHERKWWIQALSPLLMQSLYDSRMKGLRDKEVGAKLNQLCQMGLFDQTYASEWERATGKAGISYTNIIERGGVETYESVAKVLAKFNCRPEAWVAYLRDILPLAGTPYENMTNDELFIALASYAKFKFVRNADGKFETVILRDAIVNRNDPIKNQDGSVFAKNALVNPGRRVTYVDFERDPRREQGKQFLNRFSEPQFEDLMSMIDGSIAADGIFNRLISPAMEQKVVYRLIDRWLNDERWLNKKVNGEFVNKRKGRWGYRTRWWKRQREVDQAIMDMRDAFTHKFITDQLETDKNDLITIDGLQAYNIKLTPDDRRVMPIFSMFSHNKFQTAGQDPVWSLTQGTAHFFPGMEIRLTPLYPFYERNRWLYLFLAVTDDPEFQIEFAWNANEDWIKDRCYARVLNRQSRAKFIRAIGAMEGTDKDWEEEWMERAGVKDVIIEKDFGYRLKNLHVRDITAQKAEDFSDEDLVNMRKLTMTVASKVPGGGLVSGVLGSVFGKGGDEWKYRLLGTIPGITLGAPAGFIAGAFLGGPITGAVVGSILSGIGSSMTLASDQGQDDEGDEVVIYNRTALNRLRYALWQQWYFGIPFSMTAARLHGCKPEILLANSSEHDDAVPIKDFADMFKGAKDLYQEAGIGKGGH